MMSERYVQDWAALEALFKCFYKPLRAYALRFVNDKELAEDIVQDVFYELCQRHESIRLTDESMKSYLFKAVYTHSLNILNKKQTLCPLEPAKGIDALNQYMASYMQNSEQSLLLKELKEEITAFIHTLPPQCNKIFMLSRSYGLKNREIAEQLDISIKAVEKQISKALFGLKEHLIEKGLFPLLVFATACFLQ